LKSNKSIYVFMSLVWIFTSACENSRGFKTGGTDAEPQKVKPQPKPLEQKPTPQPETPEPRNNGQDVRPPIVEPPLLPPPILIPPPVIPPPIVLPPPSIPNPPPQPEPQRNPQPEQPEPRPETPEPPRQEYKPFDIPQGPQYESGSLKFPITPVANMEKGFQATNPGFRAVLKNSSGQIIAAGPMTVEAAMDGVKTPSAPGNAYPRLVMNVELKHRSGSASSGSGTLKICLAEDPNTPMDQDISCKQTGCYDRDRPCGYTGRSVDYTVSGDSIEVTRWGNTTGGSQGFQLNGGDADSPTQAALSAYHAAKDSPFVPTAAWEEAQSPLVFDLNKNKKIELISFHENKVSFDLNGDGKKTITGWVEKTDGLLSIDLNGNKAIDSGRELLGEFSAKKEGRSLGQTFKNGFAALAQYDDNFDQVIDEKDSIFNKLLVWQDQNSNGTSESGELLSLKKAGVQSISLFFERAASDDFANMHKDNDVRLIGEYTSSDGKTEKIVDVWFRYAFGSEMAAQ
jgi:hypothetical protein